VTYVRAVSVVRLTIAQQEVLAYREKVTLQNKLIEEYELEITMLRKQLESLENEHAKDQKTIEDLEEKLRKAREVSAESVMLLLLRFTVIFLATYYGYGICIILERIRNKHS
jgi:predicted transcriptional regulator